MSAVLLVWGLLPALAIAAALALVPWLPDERDDVAHGAISTDGPR